MEAETKAETPEQKNHKNKNKQRRLCPLKMIGRP